MSSSSKIIDSPERPKLYIPHANKIARGFDFPKLRVLKSEDYLTYLTHKEIPRLELPESIFSEKATKEMQESVLFSIKNMDTVSTASNRPGVRVLDGFFNERVSLCEPDTLSTLRKLAPAEKRGVSPKDGTRAQVEITEPSKGCTKQCSKRCQRANRQMKKTVEKVCEEDNTLEIERAEENQQREQEQYLEALEILARLKTRKPSLTEVNRLVHSFGDNFNRLCEDHLAYLKSLVSHQPPPLENQTPQAKMDLLVKMVEDRLRKKSELTGPAGEQVLLKRSDEEALEKSAVSVHDKRVKNEMHVIQEENSIVKDEQVKQEEVLVKLEEPPPEGSSPLQLDSENLNNIIQFLLQKNRQQINIKTINANIKTINNFAGEPQPSESWPRISPEMEKLKPLINDIRNYYMDPVSKSIFLKVSSSDTFQRENPDHQVNLIAVTKLIKHDDNDEPECADLKVEVENMQRLLKREASPEFYNRFSFPGRKLDKPSSKSPEKKPKPKKEPKKRRKKKKSKAAGGEAQGGCKCIKSKCLRLHCLCFRKKQFCGENCKCIGCYNQVKYKALVEEVRKVTKDINSEAFESRFVTIESQGQVRKYTKGCSCSKNNCLKNYCECRKNNMPCTPLCKCENCKNFKIDLEPEVAKKLCKKKSRKKKKIVFKAGKNKKLDFTQQSLSNRTLK